MAKKSKKPAKEEKSVCKTPGNLWCVSIMAVALIILTWMGSYTASWSRIAVTVIAGLIFVRSMMFNCCR